MTGPFFAVVLAAATAAPAATPPPTISRQRVSPVCTTLHQLVLPLAQMNIKNKTLTDEMKHNLEIIRSYRNTKLGDGIFLRLAQNDMMATNLLANVYEVEKQLLKSYAQYPQGKNPKVDALRQRVQNVVDIERLMANRYSAAYGAAVDNDGITGIENSLNQMVGRRPDDHAPATPLPTDLAPPALPNIPDDMGSGGQPASIADNDPKLTSSVPPGLAMRSLKWSSFAELRALLHREGPALEQQALVAAHDCDGI